MNQQLTEIQALLEMNPGSYRFLYTKPESVNSPYIFVGLNPAGKPTDPKDLYVANGSAYTQEKWAQGKKGPTYNPLQQQVRSLFSNMATHLDIKDWEDFMSSWLISNYVFYRSPKWADMQTEDKKPHIANCKMIWRQLFAANKPRIIITNGYDTYTNMIALLATAGWSKESENKTKKAWSGPHIAVLKNDQARCLVIGFGHLSTFKVINRPETKDAMENVYKLIKQYYA